MDKSDEPPADTASESRSFGRTVLDWIFLYGVTAAAVLLAFQAIYVFLTGNWTFAEGLAAIAKILGTVAVAYYLRRINPFVH
jgi:hypothetical protein